MVIGRGRSTAAKYWGPDTGSEFFVYLNKKLTGRLRMISLVLLISVIGIYGVVGVLCPSLC